MFNNKKGLNQLKTWGWSTVLSVSLLLTACSGGGSSEEVANKEPATGFNETGFPIVNEPITLSMFGPLAGEAPWEEREFFKVMKEKTNVQFDFTTPPRADLTTKKNLLLASEDLPDIFFGSGFTQEEMVEYGNQGVILPLEELIEKHAPNIQRMLEEEPEVRKAITTPEGHIFGLPMVNDAPSFWHLWYNGEWLENLGVEELPKTTEELFALLERFKNEDPNQNGQADDIPLSTHSGMGGLRHMFLGAFGVQGQEITITDGKVDYGAIQPGYRDYLEYMNSLWENELIDHESFSQNDNQKKAKGQNNQLGLFPDTRPYFVLGGEYDSTEHPVMAPVTGPGIDEPVLTLPKKFGPDGQFVLTKVNEHPAASIRWADYLYSKEGADFQHNVTEGLYWEWKDDSQTVRVIKDPPEGFENAEMYRSAISPDWGIGVPIWRTPVEERGWEWDESKFEQWLKAEDEEKLLPYAKPGYPHAFFTKEETRTVSRINRDLKKYIEQMEANFITGETPLSEWDSYVETIKGMNVDELVKINQAAFDRYEEK
ncbi:extracellular solute-binding protein [Aureibacillus halotolerans]|uniref:Putative aldouronate transport system substrate-binding protein n=1 Tax=Aureibacillus halotolerans TaxID=1508390 RepID=A0A4R6U227_9BACI|nr:extracellular solute-binding protein [Aureibacillus halotolerans]TDQ37154.1 putative aldouronate transport system substrate-binding protein [Aureibacillus halotolerans]